MFPTHLLPFPLFFLDNQTPFLLYYIPLTASTSPPYYAVTYTPRSAWFAPTMQSVRVHRTWSARRRPPSSRCACERSRGAPRCPLSALPSVSAPLAFRVCSCSVSVRVRSACVRVDALHTLTRSACVASVRPCCVRFSCAPFVFVRSASVRPPLARVIPYGEICTPCKCRKRSLLPV